MIIYYKRERVNVPMSALIPYNEINHIIKWKDEKKINKIYENKNILCFSIESKSKWLNIVMYPS